MKIRKHLIVVYIKEVPSQITDQFDTILKKAVSATKSNIVNIL